MTGILLALSASVAWGFSGFVGGVASRSLRVAVVLAVSMLAGCALLLVLAPLTGSPGFAGADAAWAVAGGLVGAGSVGCLYAAMAVGMISIVGPVSACGVIIPVVIGLARGEHPSVPQLLGMAVAATGVVLASVEKDTGERGVRLVAGLGLALAAAGGFGLWFTAIDLASAHDTYWGAATAQLVSAVSALLFMVLQRRLRVTTAGVATASVAVASSRPSRDGARWLMPMAIAAGLSDAVGVLMFAMSTTYGLLSIVSVIAALYPAFMVGFAAVFPHERPARHQPVGVFMSLVGIALITAGGA
jgi:drug/metabolite transporter (DMT)-like permease